MFNSFPQQLIKAGLFRHLSQTWLRLPLLKGRVGTAWELSEKKPLTSPYNKFRNLHCLSNSCRYWVVLASFQKEETQVGKHKVWRTRIFSVSTSKWSCTDEGDKSTIWKLAATLRSAVPFIFRPPTTRLFCGSPSFSWFAVAWIE